jgi:hypothetical protein
MLRRALGFDGRVWTHISANNWHTWKPGRMIEALAKV